MHAIIGAVLALSIVLTGVAAAQNMDIGMSLSAKGKKRGALLASTNKLLLNAGGNITLNAGGIIKCNAC